ncbi:deoxyuridine 5'-triphosphate nucleotidohydrolase [Nitzschia inconspicua]|uniref:Deoxyuridine 5'-triphosphate nucleotidohydrolase n=1 Tax=Nitzschia inconspicua TaxID=303405 RepID=A0A9K3PIN0_9STRA|nr:deoxyuridine 5'-triphosphate nucleotidohydrolase [Nitzschia inconspicua]
MATTTTTTTTAMTLQVKRLSDTAVLPVRGSEWAAGYDLSASQPTVIKAGGRGIVATDLSIACPAGTYGRIAPRSGLTVKKGIHVGAGVVDADYRGPVGVVLFNLGTEDLQIQPGDRIAQLILESIVMAPVEEVDELDDTVRGSDGFGSTGVEGIPPDAKRQRNTTTTTNTNNTIISPANSNSDDDNEKKDDSNAAAAMDVSPNDDKQ